MDVPREKDVLQRFIYDRARVRGEIVSLDAVWQDIRSRQPYPVALAAALGELVTGCVLLAATVKFEGGVLVLQIQGGQPVSLLVVECQSDLAVRATAKWEGDLGFLGPHAPLRALAYGARCVLTIDPGQGFESYQSVVPLEGFTTAQILERYMDRSEQIETRFRLAAHETRAAGLLLQKLPEGGGKGGSPLDDWDVWAQAAATLDALAPADLVAQPTAEIRRRLFADENLRLFEHLPVRFACRCSREKVSGVVRMVGRAEAEAVLREQGAITLTCEFCQVKYTFDRADVETALADADAPTPPRG